MLPSQTSAAFDEGGARGLLLNHLAVRSNGVLAFDSSDKCDTVSTEGEADSTFNTAELQALMVADATTREVCPSLSSFLFMGWTPAEITGEEAAKETGTPSWEHVFSHPMHSCSPLSSGHQAHHHRCRRGSMPMCMRLCGCTLPPP